LPAFLLHILLPVVCIEFCTVCLSPPGAYPAAAGKMRTPGPGHYEWDRAGEHTYHASPAISIASRMPQKRCGACLRPEVWVKQTV
jgi:hypothetical protein